MSPYPPPILRILACAALAAAGHAQQVRALAPIGAQGVDAVDPSNDDPGTRVEMFVNANIDRYLDRARSFLDRGDYTAAVEVLQDVIEGRTVEVFALRPDGDVDKTPVEAEPEEDATGGNALQGKAASGDAAASGELDARNAVFSPDGRIYRPVRRLCHELIARMPDVGIQIYRTKYEFDAEELLAKASIAGSLNALEQVTNRYFATLPAGRAMRLLADRLMHRGRYRAAVQVFRDLLDVYPAQNRAALGIRDSWCRFKIALCLQLAGEHEAATATVNELASDHGEDSLRISGQLETIRELPKSKLFARDTVAIASLLDRNADIEWLRPDTTELIPLWQYRFAVEEPYKLPKQSNRNNRAMFLDGGNRSTQMPFADRYGPGTNVMFSKGRGGEDAVLSALFLEHFRLRRADATNGVLIGQGDGNDLPPRARENYPRVRIAASDYALLRPVEDDDCIFTVIGHETTVSQGNEVLKSSQLVAYDKVNGARKWSSKDWLNGENGLRTVTFLAAPTVFGKQLLLPSIRKNAYTLECLDCHTGEPLWHTSLHYGGSPFFKAPGCPVVVAGGVAFVATNAGCLAAVDAFAGELRWIRRYERDDEVHKARKKQQPRASGRSQFGSRFAQEGLDSFIPGDVILHGGLVILAPCDSEMILGIDAATGQARWSLDSTSRFAPYGRLEEIVGHDDEQLFALSKSHLVSIELQGGLVRWMQKLPAWLGPKYSSRGRGMVVGKTVIVPNTRELLLFDASNEKPMRRLLLPAFDESREPLGGSFHVFSRGAWLAIGYQGGVEVFSTEVALRDLAQTESDPLRKASYLAKSGASSAAEKCLAGFIVSCKDDRIRLRAAKKLLGLVTTRAISLSGDGKLPAAMKALDEVRGLFVDRDVLLNWHLARVEICREAGDMRSYEMEQESLYSYMEGRG